MLTIRKRCLKFLEHNELRKLVEFNTYRDIYGKVKGAGVMISNKFLWMDDRNRIKRDGQKAKAIKSNKRQEVMVSHDTMYPEWI